MRAKATKPRSAARLFALYAVASLLPVLALGWVLASSYRTEAATRGMAEGRAEATLIAQSVVQPQLSGHPLSAGLTPRENATLHNVVARSITAGEVVRLRVRNLAGRVVFSDDGSGFKDAPDDEVATAEHGGVITRLTRLNTDVNDSGPKGKAVVEVYRPLLAGSPAHQVGVLEMYLPYAPIARDVAVGLHSLYRDLVVGLTVLYLLLAAISLSVTRRLRAQLARSAFLAEHDLLTGLPNRIQFHRRVHQAVRGAGAGSLAAVALVDLDRFKEVNDTLGHYNGDVLLTELARRLGASVRAQDMVARLGGDEFGLLLTDLADEADACTRVAEVRVAIEGQVDVQGLPLLAEASVGFALAPTDGADVDTLLQHADVAMYVAKSEGTGVVRYSPGQNHYDAAKLALVADLRRAISSGELVLHYQPKAVAATGATQAVEALVRWQHPQRGLLYPDEFLPIAEQTGLIEPLTAWVLAEAIRQVGPLDRTVPGLSVAVNVSARNLAHGGFADTVLHLLHGAGLPPERMLVEITETALMADPDRAALVLQRLAAAGVRVSLDDFGRGQTSLGYLPQLPLHELKIDKGFVGDMLDVPAHLAIVQSVVGLGHNLGVQVVAEGVEDARTLAKLTELGCDLVQGYLLAAPMPLEHLADWLASRQQAGAPA